MPSASSPPGSPRNNPADKHQQCNAECGKRDGAALVEIGAVIGEGEHVLACGNADTSEGAHYFSF